MSQEDKNLGQRNWYAIHTYSGYEEAVVRNLKKRVESLSLTDKIFDFFIPTEKKFKVRGGKRVLEIEKIYPGYVLINMIVDSRTWYVVRNTPRVTGFLGAGTEPVPVSQTEFAGIVDKIHDDKIEHDADYNIGDLIVITDGPFKKTDAKVIEIDYNKGRVKVLISILGRETLLDIDLLQIQRK